MCTAVTYRTKEHYFGRNLDLECSYGERVVVTPRRFRLNFRETPDLAEHYAMIGMATVVDGYPLYYEATNEKGLSVAGLNFPGNAVYSPLVAGRDNVAPFEFVPWLLGQCADLESARTALRRINLAQINFSEHLPLSPLHWIIADRDGSITVESVAEGLNIHENPVGVLTNNPPFDFHMMNLKNYMALHAGGAENRLLSEQEGENYSLGMGALGLPGDFSSVSRFVRAVFVKQNSSSGEGERESVGQFFHILGSVAMPKGCVLACNGEYEYTRYSCCCNTDRGIYYYTTYDNSTITAVDLHACTPEGTELTVHPL